MQSCPILLITRKIAKQCLLCLLLTKNRLHLTCCCLFQLSPTYRQPWNFSCKETLQHYYRPKVKISFTASNTAEFLERWVCNIYYISLSLYQYCRNLKQHFKCCHYRITSEHLLRLSRINRTLMLVDSPVVDVTHSQSNMFVL